MHAVSPAAQHVPLEHTIPRTHAWPHPPQFFESTWGSTHATLVAAAHASMPDPQSATHCPP
jgi:hypothetical protein